MINLKALNHSMWKECESSYYITPTIEKMFSYDAKYMLICLPEKFEELLSTTSLNEDIRVAYLLKRELL